MMAKIVDINDIIGKKFGRLTVTSLAYINNYNYYYNCHCDCGNDIVVLRGNLISGHTNSCGCIKVERAVAFGRSRKKENKEICTYCGKSPVYAKGLCKNCYSRYMRRGTPEYSNRSECAKEKREQQEKDKLQRRQNYIDSFNPKGEKGKLFSEDYKSGMTLQQISDKYGCSKQGVRYYLGISK